VYLFRGWRFDGWHKEKVQLSRLKIGRTIKAARGAWGREERSGLLTANPSVNGSQCGGNGRAPHGPGMRFFGLEHGL
jgi:hypothetical protein